MQSQSIVKPAGLILAGGQSRRMGRNKALLTFNGETLLQRNRRLLSEVGCEPIIVSGHPVGGVSDIYLERGPLGGLHAGLQTLLNQYPISLTPPRVLVVPVDMPKLSQDVLCGLLDVNTLQPVYYQDCALPFVLSVTVDLLRDIERCLEQVNADRSVRQLLQRFDATAINTRHRDQLVNTNTPAEWHAVVKEVRG